MNLPDPEENFLKELNGLLYGFLWGGKNDKIKRSGVSQAYEAGGLRMVDVKSFSFTETSELSGPNLYTRLIYSAPSSRSSSQG